MNEPSEKNGGNPKRRTGLAPCLDLGMLLLVCALMCMALTGPALHEWLGFGLCALALCHVTLRLRWFGEQFRRVLMPGAYRVRVNSLLNISLLVAMAALFASGTRVSHQVSALVGEHFGRTQVWKDIHNWSSVVVMALVSLHLGLNWDWIVSIVRRNAVNRPVLKNLAALPPRQPSNLWNRIAVGLALASIAALGVFAAYLATSATVRPGTRQMSVQDRRKVQDQHDPANISGEAAQPTTPQRQHPPTLRGIRLFGTTLLGALLAAIIVRYAFRLHP